MKSIRDIITQAELFIRNVQRKVATKLRREPSGKGLTQDIMINGRKKELFWKYCTTSLLSSEGLSTLGTS